MLLLASLGATRIDVLWVGKAGTFALMFSYPAFLLGDGTAQWQEPIRVIAWVTGIIGLTLAWIAAGSYVPLARRALAEGAPVAGGEVVVVKAVIMAGGEGTRLRPLTSNQPKPMLPMANMPMMEHVVNLLRQHGFEDIVVTVAFMANAIRTYFGDGSEFGVRMVYATESTPLGTAGSVRNASDELDERFLVISGDVLTDIDLAEVVSFHEKRGGLATLALKAVDNPLEFGIVITREDGSIERFLEKPTWGQVFSDTINTGIYVLEPEIFDFIPEGQAVDFSGRVVPRKPWRRASRSSATWPTATGRTWARSRPTSSPTRTSSTNGCRWTSTASSSGPGCGWARGRRSIPTVVIEGPAVIGDNCLIGPGATLGQYCTLGRNVRIGDNAVLQRSVVHDNTYLGSGVRVDGSVLGRGSDLRQGARCEEGVVLGDECFVGAHAEINAGVKVYPFKTVEAGRHRQLLDRVGVDGGPVPVRPPRGPGPGQRRHQPGAGGPAGDGLGLDLREGRDHHRLTRHQPGRPGPQAGDHGGLQRRRGQRRRPRGGHRPGHPVPGHLARPAWPASPSGWPPTTPSRWSSGSSTRTASTSTRPPSARSSGSTTARTSDGCWPGRSATSGSRPGRSSTTPRP